MFSFISRQPLQKHVPGPQVGLKDCARRFSDDRRGGVAIMFALVITSFCLFAGAGVDFGRWAQAQQQTNSALDAAVLAGARMLQIDRSNASGAIKAAQAYYTENTKSRIEVIDDSATFTPINNNKGFSGTSVSYLKTAFLGFANVTKLKVSAYSEAALPTQPLDISMMLDVTGSMGGTKISDLKLAATDLVDIVIPDTATDARVRVALVPFAEGVRLPASANSLARGSPDPDKFTLYYQSGRNTKSATYRLTECVVERAGANRYTDVAPGNGNYVMSLFNSSGVCGLPAADELVPLTDSKTTLKDKIKNLVLSNTTAGQIGTAWAWYTLSPNWNALWSTPNKADAYDTPTVKIAILMTDGEYNLQYDSNGVQTSSSGAGVAANADSTTQARELCTNMKAKGITVYTVGFALGGNATAIQTMNKCASDLSKAYTPTSGSELRQAFRDIALKINQLYLTQ